MKCIQHGLSKIKGHNMTTLSRIIISCTVSREAYMTFRYSAATTPKYFLVAAVNFNSFAKYMFNQQPVVHGNAVYADFYWPIVCRYSMRNVVEISVSLFFAS